jgi:hypothetical protein
MGVMIIEVLAIELPEYFNMLNFLNCENVGIHHLDDALAMASVAAAFLPPTRRPINVFTWILFLKNESVIPPSSASGF